MKATIISVLAAALLMGGAYVLVQRNRTNVVQQVTNANNVTIVNGKQIVEIQAKAGYQPRVSTAKAGVPTIVRFDTNGTFDCSSSIRIPSMNISKILPQTGTTDIDIGTPQITTLQGSCGMGMYPFEITFS